MRGAAQSVPPSRCCLTLEAWSGSSQPTDRPGSFRFLSDRGKAGAPVSRRKAVDAVKGEQLNEFHPIHVAFETKEVVSSDTDDLE